MSRQHMQLVERVEELPLTYMSGWNVTLACGHSVRRLIRPKPDARNTRMAWVALGLWNAVDELEAA